MKSTATTIESPSAITDRLRKSCVFLGGVFLGEDLDIEEHEDAAAPKINLNAREKERT